MRFGFEVELALLAPLGDDFILFLALADRDRFVRRVGHGQNQVVAFFIDRAAFGFNGFDMDTLIRFDLPVVSIVGNNAAWNQIRYGHIEKYGEKRGNVANLLAPTRYDRIVEAMGGYGEHVTEPDQIRPAIERARESGKPSCINVMIDPEVYSSGTRNQTMYKRRRRQPSSDISYCIFRNGN